jgi:hypothetical protein
VASTGGPRPGSLADHIDALVTSLGEAEPDALTRLRQVVGRRTALIGVDDESVAVSFDGPDLVVEPEDPGSPSHVAPDGAGRTDTETVLELLDGRLDVTDAVIAGRIAVAGSSEGVDSILHAIEIILDVSGRSAAVRSVAAAFRQRAPDRDPGPARWRPSPGDAETGLLRRLDLLPDDPSGRSVHRRPPPDVDDA